MEAVLATRDLIDYLSKVRDLEASCYQQRMIQNGLKGKLKQTSAIMEKSSQTMKTETPKKPKNKIIGNIMWPILMGLLGLGIGAGVWFILLIVLLIPSFFVDMDFIADNPQVFAIIGAIISFIVTLLIRLLDQKDEKRQYQSGLAQYAQSQESARLNYNAANQRFPALRVKIQETGRHLAETQSVLQQVYNIGYLYPKYRNMVAVCTILEYLESGRCDTLTGPNGAYNLYESELRMNIIIGKLDDVIQRLDDISDNQRMLADVIRNSTRKTHRILDSMQGTLSSIAQNTEYAQYYSRVTAENTRYLSWLKTYEVISRN